jgi:aminopeptidase N
MKIRLRCLRVLLGASLAAASVAHAQGRFQFDTTPGYLSKQVVPSRYALALDLDPARDSFSGRASIAIRVREQATAIEVHAFELSAASARLVAAGAVRPLRVTAQPASQSWRLEPADGLPIAAGDHRLEIDYAGKVNVAGEGLFVAPYEAHGRKLRMLATQLEAIYARRLFPAFDEPSFRAVFEITVRSPGEYDVVSNMPSAGRVRAGPSTEHRFAPTPPMPTYLVSVAVGRFDVMKARAAGVPLRIFTAQGKHELARHAMRTTRQVLPYYSRYFGVPYALPKLDQFAVPSVRWGAMEDWGLISYAEDNFLVDSQRSSPATVRGAYASVAHEIAHQWFGNLVTAASWEEIWLNEAFATWLERKTTDHFNPAWKVALQSRLQIDRAMTLDAGAATRAIRSGPVRETAVSDVFDPITYAKGGAVLTMIEQWVGPDDFRRGLVAYMKGQRLSNATAADLWHYIGQSRGRDVGSVAASWTDQLGFPLVQVDSRCDAGRQRITLTQSRFSSAGPVPSGQVWKIPVRYARGGQAATVLLDTAQRTLDLGACSDEPVIVNAGGAGFYRVAYEAAALQAMTRRFADLPQADRVALLSDTFALMQSGSLGLQTYLDVLEALPRVTDTSRTLLWSVARSELDFLDTAMAGRPAQKMVRDIGRRLLAPQLERLTWTPAPREDALTAELRGTLIALLAKFDHAPTIAQAMRAFDEDDAGTRKLAASMREPVTLAVGMHADRPHFERLLTRLKRASGEEERWMLAKALAAGRDPQRAEEFLAASLAGVAPANVSSAIPGLVARLSPFGDRAYRYTLDHWKPLAELAGTSGQTFLLPEAAAGFSTPEEGARLVEDQHRTAGADGNAVAAQEAESIRLRAAVKAREAPGLERRLAD